MAQCGGPYMSVGNQELRYPRPQGGGPMNILVTGKYRVGKSALINALFFQEGQRYQHIAREELFKPSTNEVKSYKVTRNDTEYYIYESPGLQDGSDNEEWVYFQMMKEKCPKLHLIIYCTPITDPLWPDDKKALNALYSTFTKDVWKVIVIALTHADRVRPASPDEDQDVFFSKQVEAKKSELEAYFKTLLSPALADALVQRIFPTATARVLALPGIHDWREKLLQDCMAATEPAADGGVSLKITWKSYLLRFCGFKMLVAVSIILTNRDLLTIFVFGLIIYYIVNTCCKKNKRD